MSDLPVNVDSTYSDTGDASVKLHQQHHDALHAAYNAARGEGTGMTPARLVGVLSNAGPPVSGDGTFVAGDYCFDTAGRMYLCTAGGTPGTWTGVGSGEVLGYHTYKSNFTMTTAATAEDVPNFNADFVFDGRPVSFRLVAPIIYHDQATLETVSLSIRRSTDSAIQLTGQSTTTGATHTNPIIVESGSMTTWPSDGVAFVVGTTYNIKVNITATAGAKGVIGSGAANRGWSVLEIITR